jgi:hypothetical protein
VAPDVRDVAPPAQDVLRVLREEVDPARIYLKSEESVEALRR